MDVVSQVTGSRGACLFPAYGHFAAIPTSESMLSTTDAYFRGNWRDERYAGLPHLKLHGITTEFDFTTPELMSKHPYWEELLRPQGLRWFAAIAIRSDTEFWSLSLQRTIEQGPFQADDLRVLKSLSDRLHAAADISRAVGSARIESASRAFELSQTPVVFLSRTAAVLAANRPAEALFARGDVGIVGGRLQPRSSAAAKGLDNALKEVLQTRVHLSSRVVSIPRPEGRGILARVIRFEDVAQNPMSLCQAIVIFHDLDHGRVPLRAEWQKIFGLTTAECRLVEALLQGRSLEEAARAMGLSRETLRSRLKDIFGKTQVSRQAELVALFARLSA